MATRRPYRRLFAAATAAGALAAAAALGAGAYAQATRPRPSDAAARPRPEAEAYDPAPAAANGDRWEYLVVQGGATNLRPPEEPSMRKERTGAFARESFVVESNLDRLGAAGWELVSVGGDPRDPTFYLKRRKD